MTKYTLYFPYNILTPLFFVFVVLVFMFVCLFVCFFALLSLYMEETHSQNNLNTCKFGHFALNITSFCLKFMTLIIEKYHGHPLFVKESIHEIKGDRSAVQRFCSPRIRFSGLT